MPPQVPKFGGGSSRGPRSFDLGSSLAGLGKVGPSAPTLDDDISIDDTIASNLLADEKSRNKSKSGSGSGKNGEKKSNKPSPPPTSRQQQQKAPSAGSSSNLSAAANRRRASLESNGEKPAKGLLESFSSQMMEEDDSEQLFNHNRREEKETAQPSASAATSQPKPEKVSSHSVSSSSLSNTSDRASQHSASNQSLSSLGSMESDGSFQAPKIQRPTMKRKESLRLPQRRSTFNNGQEPRKTGTRPQFPRSSSSRRASQNTNKDSLSSSRSEHGERRRGSSGSSKREMMMKSKSASGIAQLSRRAEELTNHSGKDHNNNNSGTAAKGIYKLLDSMDMSNSGNNQNNISASRKEMNDNSGKSAAKGTSMQGIYNLLGDKKNQHLEKEESVKDLFTVKEKEISTGNEDSKQLSSSSIGESNKSSDSAGAGGARDKFGTNHGKSIQGIYKLLGSMSNVHAAVAAEQVPAKEKSRTPRPARPSRQVKGNGPNLGRIQRNNKNDMDASEELDASHNSTNSSNSAERKKGSGTKKLPDAEDDNKKDPMVTPVLSEADDDGDDDDDANDCDTVATPNTAVAPAPPPLKEAPPPPQRRNVARTRGGGRNMLPKLQAPATTATRHSAPTQVPATPVKSAVTAAGDDRLALTTPRAQMPVVPGSDYDSVSTPSVQCTPVQGAGGAGAAPPPPRQTRDFGQRFRGGANNHQERMPVLQTPNPNQNNMARFNAEFGGGPPRAPTMSMLSPGGIEIQVPSSSRKNNKNVEPQTPMASSYKTSGSYESPYHKAMRNSRHGQVPETPHAAMSDVSSLSQYPNTPGGANSQYPNTPGGANSMVDDVSEITMGTFASNRMRSIVTPRTTPGSRKTSMNSALYNSPANVSVMSMSELTPGGVKGGADDEEDYRRRVTTPSSFHSRGNTGLATGQMTPSRYGILIEVDEEDEALLNEGHIPLPIPSTPAPQQQSSAHLVSEMTPGTHGINMLEGNSEHTSVEVPNTPSEHSQLSELTPGTHHNKKNFHGLLRDVSPATLSSPSVGSVKSNDRLRAASMHSGTVSEVSQLSGDTYGTGSVISDQVSIHG